MTTRYTKDTAQRLAVQHKLSENNLCLGFSAMETSSEKAVETLYAVTANGAIYASTQAPGDRFNGKSRFWSLVQEIPLVAEFIGTYPMPATRH